MKRPSQYFVSYEDQELFKKALARVVAENPGMQHPEELTDPPDYWRDKEFDDLEAAQAFAREGIGEVYQRLNVRPDPDAPGLWEYDEELWGVWDGEEKGWTELHRGRE
jgi:hypothetical protein